MTGKNLTSDRWLLGTHQAARLLSVDAGTVIRWADAGRFPAFRTPGGHRRILRTDLMRFAMVHGWPLADGNRP